MPPFRIMSRRFFHGAGWREGTKRLFGTERITVEKTVSCPVNGIRVVTRSRKLTIGERLQNLCDSQREKFFNSPTVVRFAEKHPQFFTIIEEEGGEQSLQFAKVNVVRTAVNNAILQKDLFLYGEKFVERSKRLMYCPVQGFINTPRDTVFRGFLKRYEVLDRESPLLAKFVIGGSCALAGEYAVQQSHASRDAGDPLHPTNSPDMLTQQRAREEIAKSNANRIWAMPVTNMLYLGFGVNGWVWCMNRMFPTTSFAHVVYKTVATTLGLSSVYTAAFVGGTQVLLESNKHVKLADRWEDAKVLCTANLVTSPLIYAVQYYLIAPKYQILYLIGINFGFNVFTCSTLQ